MAISVTNKLVNSSTTDGQSFNTASWTPTANRLALVTVMSRQAASNPVAPALTGNGLTYTQEETTTVGTQARITIFRAMAASPSAGAVTIDFSSGGTNQQSVVWIVDELDGIDTSGTNGSGAVLQSVPGNSGGANAGSQTIVLSAFGDATNNLAYMAAGQVGLATFTGDTDYTISAQRQQATTSIAAGCQHKIGQDLSVVMTSDLSNQPMGGIALEISVPVAAAATRARMYARRRGR